jgi:very-short-patch-repair endonuclease
MKLDPQLLEFAKTMRSNATDVENLMWQLLRAKRFINVANFYVQKLIYLGFF